MVPNNTYLFSIFIIALLCSIVYFLQSLYKHLRIWRMLIKIPGPKRDFFLGNFNDLMVSTEELFLSMRKWANDFYPHYTIRVFTYLSVHIISPEDCEIFLSSKKHSNKSIVYTFLKNWLRDGLLLSEGNKWLQRRRILTPAFHFNILKNFVRVFNEETEKVVEDLLEKNSNEPVDVVPILYHFSLKSICETAMGHKLDSNLTEQNEYLEAISALVQQLRTRLMNPLLYHRFIWNCTDGRKSEKKFLETLHSFTRKVIDERMRNFKGISEADLNSDLLNDDVYIGKKRKNLAMLDILLQAKLEGEDIDYEGICEEVDTFMFEGHDTTGAALSFCLMLISNHPDIQEQIHGEIKSILGEENRKPNYMDLQKMDLLERCIKESLRLYPSVYFISRNVDEDVVLNSGYVIPKDSEVYVDIIDVHQNPKIYPDPTKFDPDRFLPENCQHRHPYAYIPFSAGPRNCIGQKFAMLEIKTLITGILQRFKLIPVDTPKNIVFKSELILRTTEGIKIKFFPRN